MLLAMLRDGGYYPQIMGYIGILEKNMVTAIQDLGASYLVPISLLKPPCSECSPTTPDQLLG